MTGFVYPVVSRFDLRVPVWVGLVVAFRGCVQWFVIWLVLRVACWLFGFGVCFGSCVWFVGVCGWLVLGVTPSWSTVGFVVTLRCGWCWVVRSLGCWRWGRLLLNIAGCVVFCGLATCVGVGCSVQWWLGVRFHPLLWGLVVACVWFVVACVLFCRMGVHFGLVVVWFGVVSSCLTWVGGLLRRLLGRWVAVGCCFLWLVGCIG